MKQILKSLKTQFKKCEKIIEHREDVYERRTEKWQESDNGAVYQSDTIELDSVKDNLEEAIKSLQEMTGIY